MQVLIFEKKNQRIKFDKFTFIKPAKSNNVK